jgi:DNA helicase HerA-like ATPase
VGVYFVTQNPRDLPESVIAQLGNRLQHALRAYTPTEQKAVKSAASSFRPNPAFKTEAAITEMGVGEALVSTLEAKGAPTMVQKTLIRPPSSRLGPATDPERAEVQKVSPVFGKYDKTIDRESAYEILSKREEIAAKEAEKLAKLEAKEKEAAAKAKAKGKAPARSRRMTTTERAANNAASTASREITRYILRGIFGTRKR